MEASTEQELRRHYEALLESEPRRLIELLVEQTRLLAELREEIARLREERDTQPPGGVAPFRRPEHRRSQNPRRPGRPAGHPGSYRRAPEQVDQIVEVPLEQCPCCGEPIEQSTPLEQTIIELPVVRPVVTRLITHQACCPGCGRQVQSTHPMQVSSAIGAAGTHLGPQTLSIAGVLRHELHMTVRRSCQALESLFGLSISPGGLCQALDRVAERVRPHYEKLRAGLSGVRALYADETGWYLENHRAMLWVFCHPEATVYQVVEHRDRATFHCTVPTDFCGVLVSDCLSVYDGATDKQQKCYSHHLHAISEARRLREKPSSWLDQVESLLHTAMALGRKREEYSEEEWQKHLQVLKLAAQVSFETSRACPYEESIRQRICKQADHLFTFLEYEGVDATNNLAERQLRPAVIRRKLSCGNKTRKGANTFEILASLAATCKQTARSFFHLLLSSLKPHPA